MYDLRKKKLQLSLVMLSFVILIRIYLDLIKKERTLWSLKK